MEETLRGTIHDLSEKELLILRQEVENRKKRPVTTWLLWLFLGRFGAHRLYMQQYTTGFILLFTSTIGSVLWLISLPYLGYSGYSSPWTQQNTWLIILVIFSLLLSIVPSIWWIIDAFLISSMLADNEKKIQRDVMNELRSLRPQNVSAQTKKQEISNGQQTGVCPNCHNSLSGDSNFCPICGSRIEKS